MGAMDRGTAIALTLAVGAGFAFKPPMMALQALKDDVTVVSGLRIGVALQEAGLGTLLGS